MLKSKLAYRMIDNNIKSITELSKKLNVSRDTLTKLYNNNKVETVSLVMIEKLCKLFNCQVSDLIEYISDNESL